MTQPLFLYENRLRDAVPVASTTGAGYSVLNLRDMRDYTFWSPTAMPATVTVDCGSAKQVNYWSLYGHDLFSKSATVELRKSSDNFAANNVLVDSITPTSNKPFTRLVSTANERYWRLNFTGAGGNPIVAIAAFGIRLEFTQGIAGGFDPIGYELVAQTNRSINGRARGRVLQYREWEDDLMFENVSWTWVRDTFRVAAAAWLDSEPFLFAWNVDAYPNETYHVVIPKRWSAPHKAGSFCDLKVPLQGVIPA